MWQEFHFGTGCKTSEGIKAGGIDDVPDLFVSILDLAIVSFGGGRDLEAYSRSNIQHKKHNIEFKITWKGWRSRWRQRR
ncbi:DUF3596 domain-containing protein [Sesbania bispinosa]|nr:DUF3596 domain-containing protein [Sesbania bispinosa]